MELLIPSQNLFSMKYNTLVPLKCLYCKDIFHRKATRVRSIITRNTKAEKLDFCSITCKGLHQRTGVTKTCRNCEAKIYVIRRYAKSHSFCSKSCAATFNNTHKKHGTRISKLEKWLQIVLPKMFSDLQISFNQKSTIGSELDIFIPKLKLAFEINGVFHYKPIYSKSQFLRIQNNDFKKVKRCSEQGIELCVIDSSKQKRFTEESSQTFLELIVEMIKKKMVGTVGTAPT